MILSFDAMYDELTTLLDKTFTNNITVKHYSRPVQHAAPGKIFSGPGAIGLTAPRLLKNHLLKLIKYNKT